MFDYNYYGRSEDTGLFSQQLVIAEGGFKSQLKRADKSGASYAIIIGEDELQEGVYGLKPLRSDENQVTISCEKIIEELEKKIENNK